jgi:hypothetical protein
MTPTAKLRFVQRDSYSRNGEFFLHPHKETILQQWWVAPDAFDIITGSPAGEWRDVPLEQEEV